MARLHQFGRTFLLSALVLGLNALGLLSAMHSRHPSHARANITHGHHGPSRRASRNGNRSTDDAVHLAEDHADSHFAAKPRSLSHATPTVADVAQRVALFAPEFVDAPLANVAEVAVGSAPRAPGEARGPPLS